LRNPSIPHRLLPAALAGGALILSATLMRVWLLAAQSDAAICAGDLLQVFARGLWFDFATAIFAVTPLVLWLALAPERLARSWLYRGITLAAFFGACFGLLLLAVTEWLF